MYAAPAAMSADELAGELTIRVERTVFAFV
jgi:hypothetical protein